MLDFNLQVAAITFFWMLSFLSVFGVVFGAIYFFDRTVGGKWWQLCGGVFSLLLCVASFAIAFGLSAP